MLKLPVCTGAYSLWIWGFTSCCLQHNQILTSSVQSWHPTPQAEDTVPKNVLMDLSPGLLLTKWIPRSLPQYR